MRFEDGVFVPLNDTTEYRDGQEYEFAPQPTTEPDASWSAFFALLEKVRTEVEPLEPYTPTDIDAFNEAAAKSAGLYVEEYAEHFEWIRQEREREMKMQQEREKRWTVV